MTTGTVVFHGELYTADDLEIIFFGAHEKCIYSVGFSFVSVCNWNNTLGCINRHHVQIIPQVSLNVW